MSRESARFLSPSLATLSIVFGSALLSGLAPGARAAAPEPVNSHTRHFVQELDTTQRRALQQSLLDSRVRLSSARDLDAMPRYQVLHSALLNLLLIPSLSAALPAADRRLIESLPAHGHRRFAMESRAAMQGACRTISRLAGQQPAAAGRAVAAYQRARQRVERHLDRHYRQVLDDLTETGRGLVQGQLEALRDSDSLVHTELDLAALGFARPQFVVAFLQDACDNHERLSAGARWNTTTLGDQLAEDFDQGAVQFYQPE